jgi:hypothetical protein
MRRYKAAPTASFRRIHPKRPWAMVGYARNLPVRGFPRSPTVSRLRALAPGERPCRCFQFTPSRNYACLNALEIGEEGPQIRESLRPAAPVRTSLSTYLRKIENPFSRRAAVSSSPEPGRRGGLKLPKRFQSGSGSRRFEATPSRSACAGEQATSRFLGTIRSPPQSSRDERANRPSESEVGCPGFVRNSVSYGRERSS